MSANEPRTDEHDSADARDSERFDPHVPGVDYDILDGLVGYAVRRAQISIYEDFDQSMAGTGITPPLFAALVIIGANPGLKQTALGRIMGIARSGAMAKIDRLEAMDLVERRRPPGDRRSYGIFLTGDGVRTLDRLKSLVSDHDRRISHSLSDRQKTTLFSLLAQLG